MRWSSVLRHALDRWDRTARLVVLALVVTTCVTAALGVLGAASAGAVAVAVAGWLTHRDKAA
jgi:di/tricarboxylate transporter